ncbi:MAG: T9SS type A sorting domain-containing protein [Bacteroidota bacterium]
MTGFEEDPRVDGELPRDFVLLQNYPNSFNPSTTIEFALPGNGFVTFQVYNVLGEQVASLVEGDHSAGTFKTAWDASGQPSGVYFYRLTAGDSVQTRKMMLMK